jgi:TonB-linked SusC/RagA family outer membrane protein
MRTRVRSWSQIFVWTALIAAAIPLSAEAQNGRITGTIVDATNGGPLSSVQVFVEGRSTASLTNVTGNFVLENVPPGTYTIVAQRIGYTTVRESDVSVAAGATTSLNLSMTQQVLALQEIVATGLIDPVEGARAPIAVGRLSEEMMPVTVAAGGAVENLQGRIAGVRMNRGSGQPGSSPTIMLRSPTSLRGGGAPLIVVDGVILSAGNTGAAPTVDIASMDIESIEVIRGAAAASLYGSRANSGVISITTRDGSGLPIGQTRFSATSEFGISQNVRDVELNNSHGYLMDPTNSFYVDANGNQVSRANRKLPPLDVAIQDKPYPTQLYDNIGAITHAGNFMNNSFSVAGNATNTNFNVTFNSLKEEGSLIGNEGYERNSFRVNLDHRFIDALSLGVSMFHSRSHLDGIAGDPFTDVLRAPRDVDFSLRDENGNYIQQPDPAIRVQNPLWEDATRENSEKGTRTLANANLAWSPAPWVTTSGSLSYDRGDSEDRSYTPKGTPNDVGSSGTTDGSISFDNDLNEAWNAEAQVTLRRDFGPLNVRTTVRGIMERDLSETGSRSGSNFLLAGIPQLSNIRETDRRATSSQQEVRATGYLWDTALDYSGKYIFTVLGRRDGSSLFGPDNRWHNYYRLAGAWRIGEESWFNIPNVNELKVSLARGTAGGRPSFDWQYETWTLTGGIPVKAVLGNRELAPEHTTEHEISLNLIMYDRFGIVLTHARQRTEDQLNPVPLPAITGYSTQWVNTGTISGHSTEFTFEAQMIQRPNFGWTSMVVADYSNAVISEWDAPCYAQGWRWNCKDIPVYGIYSRWLLKDKESLNQHDAGSLLQYADQFEVNDEGFLVWVGEGNHYWEGMEKGLWGTVSAPLGDNGRVLKWGHPFYELTEVGLPHRTLLGEGNPINFGWINNVRVAGFNLHAALHASIGGDTNNRIHQRMYNTNEATAPKMDQAGKPDGLKKPIAYYRSAVDGDNSYTIEDSSYLKLRTLSATYDLNPSQLSRFGLARTGMSSLSIGLVARNVFTLTNYDGFDPEAGLNLQDRSNADAGSYPPTRSLTAEFSVTF